MAVQTMPMLCAYLRPGEAHDIRVGGVTSPAADQPGVWSGARDDSVLLDSAWCPWLGEAMRRMARGPSERRLFDYNYPAYVKAFQEARPALKLDELAPYQARHSGPPIDRARRLRSQEEVARRGRWQSPASVQRYKGAARRGQT